MGWGRLGAGWSLPTHASRTHSDLTVDHVPLDSSRHESGATEPTRCGVVAERDRRPHPQVTAPTVSGQEGQLEAAGLAAGAGDDDEPDDDEPDDDDEDVEVEEDDAGVAAGVDAAGLRAVDFAPARASLR